MMMTGWILPVVLGAAALSAGAMLWPIWIRMVWTSDRQFLRVRYLVVSYEMDFKQRCRRIRILGLVVSTRLAEDTSARDSASDGTNLGGRRRKLQIVGTIQTLWAYRGPLRHASIVLVRLSGRLIRAWHVEHADVRLTVGLGDPAQTGMATGWFSAVWPALRPTFPAWDVSWEPNFEKRLARADVRVVLRLIPARAVYHLCQAFVSLPWRGLWGLRKALAS